MDIGYAILFGLLGGSFILSVFTVSVIMHVTATWRDMEKARKSHVCPKSGEPEAKE